MSIYEPADSVVYEAQKELAVAMEGYKHLLCEDFRPSNSLPMRLQALQVLLWRSCRPTFASLDLPIFHSLTARMQNKLCTVIRAFNWVGDADSRELKERSRSQLPHAEGVSL